MASSTKTTPSTLDTVKSRRYDAIIVGGGVAGLVAAARLSEDKNKKILVIEAGADRRGDPRIDTPGLLMGLWGDRNYDWDFWSEPQTRLNGRQIPQPRGKVLGGSSAINVTAIAYPTPRNFDAWAKLGNKGWSWETIAPYYRKFHTFYPASQETSELLSLDSYIHPDNQGTDGPLLATFPDAYGPFNQAWMAAFNGVGFSNTIDPILGRKQGAFTPPNSVDLEKKRSYSASAYYSAEIEKRPNLDLLTETFVNKVLLQSSDNGIVEAKGVQICSKDGSVDEIYADDEVLLAAGALQSPQLLENSGIGSKEILQRYGVEVLIDNPGVGENLQDHCFASISFEIADDQISADVVRDPAVIEALLKQYEDTRTGPLSGVPFSLAYLPPVDFNGRMTLKDLKSLIETHLDLKDPSLSPAMIAQFAELQSMMLDPSESTCYYGLGPAQMHIRLQGKTSMSQAYRQQLPENFITIMVGLNHPLSRGSVHIGSSDPKSSPLIDPCYLSHPLDMEILARGIQFIDKIVNQQAMKQMLKTNNRIPPLAANLADLEDAKQVVKDRLWTTYHSSCTCAMMPQEIGGVVNDRLVVHGTKNLRVIDASIFPMITLGNIQATVYAVAERASDLIKEDWAKGGPIPKI